MGQETLAIIGSQEMAETSPFGSFSEDLSLNTELKVLRGKLSGVPAVLLSRGSKSTPTPPHRVDYMSIINTVKAVGATRVVATNMVGSLRKSIPLGHKTLVTQFLDFTKQRAITSQPDDQVSFFDMTDPYCPVMNSVLMDAAARLGIQLAPEACYVATDGPRFETRAEVNMYAALGADIVGMTLVQETIFARENGVSIASLAGVVNLGAGLSDNPLNAEDFVVHRNRLADEFSEILVTAASSITGHPRG